ncbi:hypothetical protein MKK75_03000 [Methylobacterium sp. J-030]|uniref:hypothetical protein n=1 Tax=Methylobacterium sp. J-030 TaxID=2836627 RepID=UPI001FBA3B9D|nr:hypothetical protein [Methylobacterium sp. J-030]MCJ2067783.1 hypothetical protein [Methylobacterium sp. J-030]
MILSLNGPTGAADPNGGRAQRVAELAIELLEASRDLGDAAVIAAAEFAAYQAAVALARSIEAQDRDG